MRPSVIALVPLTLYSVISIGCSASTRAPAAFGAAAPAAATNSRAPVAEPPKTGSGTGVITDLVIVSSRNAGPNVIQERRLEGTVQGALQGTFVEEVEGVIHKDGLVTFHGTLEFTGTLEGCGEGTLTLGLSGTGQAGLPVTEASVRVIRPSGSTLAVHGTGTVSQVGPNLTYEVQYICR